jgi:methionyl-tRNA formyltransferase
MPGKRKKANGIRSERFCQVEFFLGISFIDLLVFFKLKKKTQRAARNLILEISSLQREIMTTYSMSKTTVVYANRFPSTKETIQWKRQRNIVHEKVNSFNARKLVEIQLFF